MWQEQWQGFQYKWKIRGINDSVFSWRYKVVDRRQMKSESLLNMGDMKVSLGDEIETLLRCFVVAHVWHLSKCIKCSKCEC